MKLFCDIHYVGVMKILVKYSVGGHQIFYSHFGGHQFFYTHFGGHQIFYTRFGGHQKFYIIYFIVYFRLYNLQYMKSLPYVRIQNKNAFVVGARAGKRLHIALGASLLRKTLKLSVG